MSSTINSANTNLIENGNRNIVRASDDDLYVVFENDTAGTIEVWKSTNGGTTWAEVDSANNPSGMSPSIAIDSNDLITIAYMETGVANTDLHRIEVNTGSDTFQNDAELVTVASGITSEERKHTSIVVDGHDNVHIIFSVGFLYHGTDYDTLYYVDGAGANRHVITSGGPFHEMNMELAVCSYNFLTVVSIDRDNGDLYAFKSTKATPTSGADWDQKVVDASVSTDDDNTPSIAVDSNGDVWIAYVDSDGTIDIAKQPAVWTDAWTIYSNGNAGDHPSLFIDGTTVYVFYIDDNDDVVYDKYDGSWAGETVLQTGTFTSVDVIEHKHDPTYSAFDSSDAAASDPDGAWIDDADAYDNGDISDEASTIVANGSVSNDYLHGQGVSAPVSGSPITQVRARMYVTTGVAGSGNVSIYTNALAELLGTISSINAGAAAWGSWITLDTPSGGWTWQKVKNLEGKAFKGAGFAAFELYAIEIEVTFTAPALTQIDYVFEDGTDIYWDKLSLVSYRRRMISS